MLKKLILSVLILIMYALQLHTQDLPIALQYGEVPLRQLIDASLQQNLEIALKRNKKINSLISNKRMAVGLVDLSNNELLRFAQINGNEMMYAASLPKIAVLLASIDAIENCELEETSDVLNDMHLMISKSNNHATTRMIDRVGYNKIEDILTCDEYALYDEELGGGLWVGKRYAAGGATNREPLKNLSHAATVTQVCRFYFLLLQGKLVSPERSKQMLDILEDPALHHKFVNTLGMIAPNARLFRKSGTWKSYHADSVLVWGKKRKYILVGLIQDSQGEKILRDLVNQVEKVLKK